MTIHFQSQSSKFGLVNTYFYALNPLLIFFWYARETDMMNALPSPQDHSVFRCLIIFFLFPDSSRSNLVKAFNNNSIESLSPGEWWCHTWIQHTHHKSKTIMDSQPHRRLMSSIAQPPNHEPPTRPRYATSEATYNNMPCEPRCNVNQATLTPTPSCPCSDSYR